MEDTGYLVPNVGERLKGELRTDHNAKQNPQSTTRASSLRHTYFGYCESDDGGEDNHQENDDVRGKEYCDINFDANSAGSQRVQYIKYDAIPNPASNTSQVDDGYLLPNEEDVEFDYAIATIQHAYMDFQDVLGKNEASGEGNKYCEITADKGSSKTRVSKKMNSNPIPAQHGSSVQDQWGYLVVTADEDQSEVAPHFENESAAYLVPDVEECDQTHTQISQITQSGTTADEDCAAPDLQHSYFGFQDSFLKRENNRQDLPKEDRTYSSIDPSDESCKSKANTDVHYDSIDQHAPVPSNADGIDSEEVKLGHIYFDSEDIPHQQRQNISHYASSSDGGMSGDSERHLAVPRVDGFGYLILDKTSQK